MSGTYIYERAGWPRFQLDLAALGAQLAAVRHRQGRLIGHLEALGLAARARATLQSLTEEVVKSTEIEGEVLDREQVRSSVARRLGVDIGALTAADRDVEGVVEMILDATQNYDKPLTKRRLFGWHAALFPAGSSGTNRITVGAWRKDEAGPMQVTSGPIGRETVHYRAPSFERVDAEMQAFLRWFNGADTTDPVLKAGIAHLWFVTIHPFDDGNGRIARALTDMLMARSEKSPQRFYSMSAQIRKERRDYYDRLERTQKGSLDITLWIEWFLSCLGRAFESSEAELATVYAKAEFWEGHQAANLNERQRLVLNRLLDGFEGKLTSAKWAKIATCSPDTALRDIDGLIAQGILKKDAGGGRSTSYSLSAGETNARSGG